MTHQIQNIAPFALIHSITSSGDIGSGMLPGRVNGAHPATSTLSSKLLNTQERYLYMRHADATLASDYRKSIRKELENCRDILKEGEGKLLPTYRWDSAVNSGHLKLLKFDEVNMLSEIYHRINRYTLLYL